MAVLLAVVSVAFVLAALAAVCWCIAGARTDRDMDAAFREHLKRQNEPEGSIRHWAGSGWRN